MKQSEERTSRNGVDPLSSGSVRFGRYWRFATANDGKWETADKEANAIRVHRIGLESVTSFDGLKATCLIVGKWKLTWAKL
jgi:hypothetical protein